MLVVLTRNHGKLEKLTIVLAKQEISIMLLADMFSSRKVTFHVLGILGVFL